MSDISASARATETPVSGRLALVAGLTLVLMLIAYYPLIVSGPGDGHSLLVLEHGATTPWWQFWKIDGAEGPRFVVYHSFVLDHLLFGFWSAPSYAINVLLIWLAAVFVGLFAHRLTRDLNTAILAAGLFLLYDSLLSSVEWLISRQEPMVIILGLGSLLLVMQEDRRFGLWKGLSLFVLLTLMLFTKEYGLVFIAGIGWYVLTRRRNLLLWVGAVCVASVLLFLFVRLTMASGIHQQALQCDEMGYFFDYRRVCTTTDLSDLANLKQLLWNAAVGLVAQLVPQIFNDHGLVHTPYALPGFLALHAMRVHDWIFCAAFLGLSVAAIVGRMPFLGLCAIMILANAVLSAPFFRTRNVVFGYVPVSVVFAFGALVVADWLGWFRFGDRLSAFGRRLATLGDGRESALRRLAMWVVVVGILLPQLVLTNLSARYFYNVKQTRDYVCREAKLAIERDVGGGRFVDAATIFAIYEANGLYLDCPIFLENQS